jgi:hypothetical protein
MNGACVWPVHDALNRLSPLFSELKTENRYGSTAEHGLSNIGPVCFNSLKFNFHHINIFSNACSTKCRLIVCMLAQIMSNLRNESIKPN